MVTVIGVVFGAGVGASRKIWPASVVEPWRDRVDRVCYAHYPKIADAFQSGTLSEARLRQASVESRFADALAKLEPAVPVEQKLAYNQWVSDHYGIAYWRRVVGRREADLSLAAPSALDIGNLTKAEKTAQLDAKFLGLTICGQAKSQYE